MGVSKACSEGQPRLLGSVGGGAYFLHGFRVGAEPRGGVDQHHLVLWLCLDFRAGQSPGRRRNLRTMSRRHRLQLASAHSWYVEII